MKKKIFGVLCLAFSVFALASCNLVNLDNLLGNNTSSTNDYKSSVSNSTDVNNSTLLPSSTKSSWDFSTSTDGVNPSTSIDQNNNSSSTNESTTNDGSIPITGTSTSNNPVTGTDDTIPTTNITNPTNSTTDTSQGEPTTGTNTQNDPISGTTQGEPTTNVTNPVTSTTSTSQVVPTSSTQVTNPVTSSSNNQTETAPTTTTTPDYTQTSTPEPTDNPNIENVTLRFYDDTLLVYEHEFDKGIEMPNFPNASTFKLSKNGYTLVGWRMGNTVYSFTDSIVLSDDFSFYAEWQANTTPSSDKVKISFFDGEDLLTAASLDIKYTIEFPNPLVVNISKTGYELIGWRSGDTVYGFDDTFIVTEEVAFYAEWKAIPENKSIVYFYNEYELLERYEFDRKSALTSLPNSNWYSLSKTGYNHIGWRLDETVYKFADSINITLSNEIYEFIAEWEQASSPVIDTTGLDIFINYSGIAGISFRGNEFYNSVDKHTYVLGDLLPVWKTFSNQLNINIRDASAYTENRDNVVITELTSNGFHSQTDASQCVDLLYNTVSYINRLGAQGLAVDLVPYLENGSMPYFKAFLDANPSIRNEIASAGCIYYTPYFDSYNVIEKSLLMDTAMVKLILDEDYDGNMKDTINNQGGSDNTTGNGITTPLNGNFMKPFIGTMEYNYENDKTVNISVNAKLQTITIKKTSNIIALQNELLASGTSGKDLRKQFRDYLSQAYQGNIGSGKVYEHLSDIFISESASYNTDDLIALMRVIKASSELITGNINTEVEILVPRGTANNRVQNILQIAKIFGIQGLTSKTDLLYFDANGKINDAAITKQTYEALGFVSQLYAEGLILGDFYNTALTNNRNDSTCYSDKYIKHTKADSGYGFMMFDYSETQGASNDYDSHGLGTKPSIRQNGFANIEQRGFMPVLSPLTYWVTEKYNTDKYDVMTASIYDRTYKTLVRYEEDNRSLKSTSWFIPATSDNIEDAIKLMDYLYSDYGRYINDFGPTEYWKDTVTTNHYGEVAPEFNDAFWKMFKDLNESSTYSIVDYWTFLRQYLGAGLGIGYQKTDAINYYSLNQYTQIGKKNLDNSIISGATILAQYNNPNSPSFAVSIPVGGFTALSSQVTYEYQFITDFFAADKGSTEAKGWAKYITALNTTGLTDSDIIGHSNILGSDYSMNDVYNLFEKRSMYYLYNMAYSININYIPDYCSPVI